MVASSFANPRVHAGAGVPWRRPSSHARGPSSFCPSCVSGQKGPVIYGSYVDEVLAILPASGVVGERKFVHANHLYSVAALTDNAGAVVERYRYDAYGQRTVLAADGVTVRTGSSHGNQVGFTGRYLDKETGLWYFRARNYSGSLGRFASRDPLTYVDGWNLYEGYFVPNKVDPTGKFGDYIYGIHPEWDPAPSPPIEVPKWLATVACIGFCMLPGGSLIFDKYNYENSDSVYAPGNVAEFVSWTATGEFIGATPNVPWLSAARENIVKNLKDKYGATAIRVVAITASKVALVTMVIDGVFCTGSCTGAWEKIGDIAEKKVAKEVGHWVPQMPMGVAGLPQGYGQ